MSMKKIIKNLTGSTLQILNRDVPNNGSYDIAQNLWLELSTDTDIHSLVTLGDLVVNNSLTDLDSVVGLAHITNINGVEFKHDDVGLLPGAGTNAPALVNLDSSAVGFHMEIGDKVFGQTRIDGLVGDFVEFQMHYTIDNNVANRHIQFEVNYFTTNGVSDNKTINVPTGTIDMGPIEVASTPWVVREIVVNIPASAFQNGEKYLYVGITRVIPDNPLISPTNNPLILRYCKRYYKEA